MKLIILLSIVACSSCAKLDRNYLPPSNARSSGGSPFLQAPSNSPRGNQNYQDNGFGQTGDYQGNGLDNGNFGNDFSQNGNDFNQNGNGFNQNGFGNSANGNFNGDAFRAERPQAAFERNAAILRQDSQNDGETYSYAYETENGISAEESGVATNGVEAQGSYSYTGDDGQVYTVRYTADQNGFVPIGDHLPTPPPVPEEIQKALEQNARDEAAGIYDDGSYSEGKYGDDNNQYNGNGDFNNGNNYNNGNDFNNANNYNNGNDFNGNSFNANNGNDFNGSLRDFNGDEDSVVTNAAFRTSQPSRGFDGATKAYLPPRQNQRGQGRDGFGPRSRSRPSFNARDGYNY